jgi:minor extracellular serine protease Vpr
MRLLFFLASTVLLAAQDVPGQRPGFDRHVVPNRYIVLLETDPAVAVSIGAHVRYSASNAAVQARRIEIRTQHTQVEQMVRGLGGTVSYHFDTIVNGMAVTLSANAAVQLSQSSGVKGVYPVKRHRLFMDQAASVHRFTQAWQTLAGGAGSAGAGIKIGILDTGVDNTHPAFQNFPTPVPNGFPIISGVATTSNTNSKVIVARVYSDLPLVDNTQSDGNDYFGHGTTVAGIAGGLSTNPGFPGIGAISGVAPGAWIGNYKVGDDYGDLDDVTFTAGLEDAFNDGMNVVNYSAGGSYEDIAEETGPVPQAIANALAGGMVVVVAAGNSGPGVGTIASPAASAGAIAVGAMENQRWFWFAANVGGTNSFLALLSGEEQGQTSGDVTGALVDVSTLTSDTGGYACSALPGNSLTNQIALIQRGGPNGASCSFSTKLNNAQIAGAVGAILYDNKVETMFDYTQTPADLVDFELGLAPAPVDSNNNARVLTWSMGSATLPAVLVAQADGQAIQQMIQANPGVTVDLDFDGKTALPYPSNLMADFSSVGPTPGGNIKPDIVAVGDDLVAPMTTQYESTGCPTPFGLDLVNGCYQPYTFLDTPFSLDFLYGFGYGAYFDDGAGTSFATPMVTGSVAVIMGAVPGLTGPQYRSLVTNGAGEFDQYPANNIAGPQLAGAGRLDLLGSLQTGLASNISTLNFQPQLATTGGGTTSSMLTSSAPTMRAFRASGVRGRDATAASASGSETFTLTNTGSSDTFTITVQSIDGMVSPGLDAASFALNSGASHTVTVTIPGAAQLASGQYHGFLVVNGTQGQRPLRIPYWYGVAGTSAQNMVLLFAPGADPSTCTDYFDFRLMDLIGLPFEPATSPVVTTPNPLAQVVKVYPMGDIAGTYEAEIVTGRPDGNGNNTFTVSVGNTTFAPVTIAIDNSGATSCGGGGAAQGTNSTRSVSLKTAALRNQGRLKARAAAATAMDR